MKTQQFNFEAKGIEYWRAQTRHLHNFDAIVHWFQTEHGLSKARAIIAARRTDGQGYNQWSKDGRPSSGRGTQNLSMPRTRTGSPFVTFRGL